jgi:hypothetical protein
VILALFYVGARRLEHLRYLARDPLVTRFCGLARLPTRRTVANWLRQFSHHAAGANPAPPGATGRSPCVRHDGNAL